MPTRPRTLNVAPVNWELWTQVDRVEAWKACALSVGVEPSSLEFELDEGVDVLLSWTMADDLQAEFSLRCDIVTTYVGSPVLACFHKYGGRLGEGNQLNSLVSIHEFVSWARSRSWSLPPNMTAMIPEPPEPEVDSEEERFRSAETAMGFRNHLRLRDMGDAKPTSPTEIETKAAVVSKLRRKQSRPRAPRPEWDTWRELPTAMLWEAVALSLDAAPDPEIQDDPESYRPKDYEKRLLTAHSHARAEESFLMAPRPAVVSHDAVVDLRRFGSWARSLGWTLPAEFPLEPGTGSLVNTDAQSRRNPNAERDAWIVKRLVELKKEGKRKWTETVSRETGLSPQWIREIWAKARSEADRVEESKDNESLQEKERANTSKDASNPLKKTRN